MGVRRNIALVGAGLLVGACLRFSPYVCDGDQACRSQDQQGVCQTTGFCSYPDTSCNSRQRYDEFAPSTLAGRCVSPGAMGTTQGTAEASSGESTAVQTGPGTGGISETGTPNPACGNGMPESGEACDDGNAIDGDGCNSDCVESGTVIWDVVNPELGSVARGVAVGPDGDVAVAGSRVEGEDSDILVLFYSREGVPLWQRVHASPEGGEDEGSQVAFDDSGSVYVAAYQTRDDLMPAQGNDAWTRQYDTQGAEGWTVTESSPGSARDRALDVKWSGSEVVIAGHTDGDAWVQGHAASGGEVLWTFDEGIDEMFFDMVNTVAIDGNTVYAAGERANGEGGRDAWLGRFSVEGDTATVDWVEIVDPGGAFRDSVYGLALAADGGLVVGGRRGELAWLAKYGAEGGLEWERYDDTLQVPADVRGVAVDSAGQVIAVGYETDPVQGEDAFVTKYDAEGAMLWTQRYDGPAGGTDRARAVAVASDRTIAVSGFTDAVDGQRLWVRKYAP